MDVPKLPHLCLVTSSCVDTGSCFSTNVKNIFTIYKENPESQMVSQLLFLCKHIWFQSSLKQYNNHNYEPSTTIKQGMKLKVKLFLSD